MLARLAEPALLDKVRERFVDESPHLTVNRPGFAGGCLV